MRRLGLALMILSFGACAKSSKDDKTVARPAIDARLNCRAETFHATTDDIPRLRPAATCPKFVGYLIAALTKQATQGRMGFTDQVGDSIGLLESTADGAGSGPVGHSTTNVQEAGIDEADFVKTDGEHIYLLHGDSLKILKSWPPTEVTVLSTTTIQGWPVAMLLFKDRLAVVSQNYEQASDVVGDVALAGAPSGTRLSIIDVSDPKAPEIERTLDMEVSYLDARLINGRLLFAGNAYVSLPIELVSPGEPAPQDESEVRRAIAQAVTLTTFDDWLPSMLDSARGDRELMVDSFDALYLPTVTGTVGATAILSLDLAHAGADLNKVVLSSEGGMLYATADALYLAYADRWWWWSWGGGNPDAKTYLHRMRLNEEAVPHYTGSVTVPGWLNTPYWMSEYDGHLRVVTSAGGTNRMRTFDAGGNGDPEFMAEVKGFAPDETITGVRFMGARAYVSTAIIRVNYIKDPFFTFDLGDPAAPKLMGALEMPGYTTYIHPLSADYVLAVGMFAASMGDPVTAVQVQVFDVRDFANPVTASQHVFTVGDTGISFSEALNSPHAFTFYEPQGIFALPLADFTGSWSTAFNGLVAMRVGADASLTELGRVNHYALGSEGYWASDVRRSIVMEGDGGTTYLYSLSAQGLIVNDTADFTTVLDSVKLSPWTNYR